MRNGTIMAAALLLPALTSACGKPAALSADGAWVRLNAVPGRPAAGYVTVHGGAADEVLVAVTTPAALKAELHESMAGGMRPLPSVPVPAGGAVAFAPGGKHIMLIDPDPHLTPGTRTTLSLRFTDGRQLSASAKVVSAADPAPRS